MTKLRQAIDKKLEFFKSRAQEFKTPDEQEAYSKYVTQWLCRNDLYYLGLITGHSKFIDPFHKDLCDKVSLMNWQIVQLGIMPASLDILKIKDVIDEPLDKLQRLFLMFRSAFKTTIITKLHTAQLLLNFPNLHIAISHNTQVNASDNLISIKNLFLNTELRSIFPEYIPKTREWGNQTGFSVACRTDYTMNGDNVEAIGIGTEVTGRKYHIFKNDDIVTEDSVTNEEQLKKSRDYIEMHKYLFVNPSLIVEDYSGTKYHHADAYTMLEENPSVDTVKQKLLQKDKEGVFTWKDEKYNCVLPLLGEEEKEKGFTRQGILDLMKDEYKFNCQNMLNPSDPKKIKFTNDMIQYFTHIPDGLNYYLVVDPADSEEKRACYTAMKVIGVDSKDDWYWVDGVFDKIDDRERIDEAIRLAIKWRVFEVLWEYLSFGRTDSRNFERASRLVPSYERTWSVPREIKAMRISKDDRILGLNDRYSRRKIFWPPRLMYYSKFEGKTIDIVRAQEYEFLGFPLVSHKDLLDAESFMLQIDLIKGDKQKELEVSKFAHIKDPNQRGATEVFWREWEMWKEKGFVVPNEVYADNL